MSEFDDIKDFLKALFLKSELSSEEIVLVLIYVYRFVKNNNIKLHNCIYRNLFIVSTLIVLKMCNDDETKVKRFLKKFGFYSKEDLLQMEKNFCSLLDYKFYVSQATYCKYMFELKSMNKYVNK